MMIKPHHKFLLSHNSDTSCFDHTMPLRIGKGALVKAMLQQQPTAA